MDFSLTKEEELIQKAAKEFSEKVIEPLAEQIDRTNEMPQEVIDGLIDLGMFGITMPEEYGGGAAGHIAYALAMEQLSKSLAGVGMLVSVHTIGNSMLLKFATDEQKKKAWEPKTIEIDDSNRFPMWLWEKFCEQSWCGLMVPKEYGGLGLSLLDTCLVFESAVRAGGDVGSALALGTHVSIGSIPLLVCGNEEQKKSIFPNWPVVNG